MKIGTHASYEQLFMRNTPKFSVFLIFLSTLATLGCSSGESVAIEPMPFADVSVTPTPVPQNDPNTLTIAAVGDIMLGSPFPNETRMPPNDGKDLLSVVSPILSAADIAFGNLEGPMTDGGESTKCRPPKPGQPVRCFAFRMPTRYGQYLKEAGFDVLSLANNHALDFGSSGSASTRKTLDALGIKHAGSDKVQHSTAYLRSKERQLPLSLFA